MDEVRQVVHLPLHRNPPVAVTNMLRKFHRHPRPVKVGAQKPPELDDLGDDGHIHVENEDENGELFTPGESDVWALHAADVGQDKGYPTSEIPNEDEPPSTRIT